jgi:HJR/Mrr/RecB family endonuclease
MTIKLIKKIVNNIISVHWLGKVKVDDLIVSKLNEICDKTIDSDEVLKELGDPNSKSFEKFIKAFKIIIAQNHVFSTVIIYDELDGIYIEKKHNDKNIDLKYKEVINFINDIEKTYNKGINYEKFCKFFLEDLGIKCETTNVSGDKGIDILGSYFANIDDDVANLVFYEHIYMLVQTKYFSSQIDTPVIRKLVGDSIFIRFDELDYLTIKHNAVHLIVFSHNGFTQPARDFADKNKVKTFDSTDIAHIIAAKPYKDWKCLKLVFY